MPLNNGSADMSESSLIVIPVRMASTRFPGKPLAKIAGLSMIERVWRIACAVEGADSVLIATDSQEIEKHAAGFGAEVVITSSSCRTGSDRVAMAVREIVDKPDIVFSLQGDAVLTPPWIVEAVLAELKRDAGVEIATPAVRLRDSALDEYVQRKAAGSTTGTNVVFDNDRNALYFSKALIPFNREQNWEAGEIYQHIGLYGYRLAVLERFCQLPPGRLENIEKLEQLRALENGIGIRVVEVDYRGRTPASVDRPEDVALVEDIISREGEIL